MAVTRTATPAPGPTGHPLLGSALDLRRDPLGTFVRTQREYGDVVRVTAGPPGLRTVMYGVFSAEGAQQVLATQSRQLPQGQRLLRGDPPDRRQRPADQPGRRLPAPTPPDPAAVHQAPGRRLRQRRSPRRPRRRRPLAQPRRGVDVSDEMTAWRCARSPASCSAPMSRPRSTSSTAPTSRSSASTSPGAATPPLKLPRSWPTPSNKRAAAATRASCTRSATRSSRRAGARAAKQRTKMPTPTCSPCSPGRGTRRTASLDATELRDQVLVFLLAGHETTATSLAFALHLLARHPEARAGPSRKSTRCCPTDALHSANHGPTPVPDPGPEGDDAALPGRPADRQAVGGGAEIDGHVIPAGVDILISPWVTHRHPAHWHGPRPLRPGPLHPGPEAARPRYAWFPFGGGPRACIGQPLLDAGIGDGAGGILREYDLETPDADIPVTAAVTLQAVGEARVRVRARR